MQRPYHFRDEMVEGAFSFMRHDHFFEARGGQTLMKDRFEFASPLGVVGRVVDGLFLRRYMLRFLVVRNAALLAHFVD